ncbi:MAG: agmatine deiminase family protein, partial [Candidatus Gagatemarchaeaceae archaeon]
MDPTWSMPAEWERHEATWLSWPKNPDTFPPEVLPGVEAAYTTMVDALSRGEKVRVLVDDLNEERRVADVLSGIDNIEFHRFRTADVWVRDYGPSTSVGEVRRSPSGCSTPGAGSTTT